MDDSDSTRELQRNTQDSSGSEEMAALFRPPIQRNAAAVLDRTLFSKIVPIAAARVTDKKQISRYRSQLEHSRELLRLERIIMVREDPDPTLASQGGKCLLLQPEVKPDDPTTWSPLLRQAVAARELGVIPYNLHLDYDYWTYLDIMKAILPEDSQDEIPVGFSIVGHIAHLNLREAYLPFKTLIATVLLDKNPSIRTVINKTTTIDDDGTFSSSPSSPTTTSSPTPLSAPSPSNPPITSPTLSKIYRTFPHELLAGPPSLLVTVRSADCVFTFDYARVYWNSRLDTEHRRLVSRFLPGEVVVDVMAGVGPFAVPAGKKGVWVWANDLNPECFRALGEAVGRNKVHPFVRPFNLDGHAFIPYAASELLRLHATGQNNITIPSKTKRSRPRRRSDASNGANSTNSHSKPSDLSPPAPTTLSTPPTISHFVMNLPGSAISFLPAFRGLYAGHEALFAPHTPTPLPMVHVHCFATKSEDNVREGKDICERISESLGARVVPRGEGRAEGDGEGADGAEVTEVEIHDVRDVAPLKRMFCASFRLPRSVAFAARREEAKTDAIVGGGGVGEGVGGGVVESGM